ncbi:hypothetical protein SAMN02910297_01444 [Methanobrevibacter olleyae]|uniref:Uncharacterized protein n=1 Tax=Methanobrevibacter olleyae TaxID=294671 RepID=A0A1I4JI60_METOL|nr:hypothetical protein [Methanobrevibacter olleyae]SFL65816.1 hypothetical protein SAMN02910297_01444 [Methanobrevibacter olleyae]
MVRRLVPDYDFIMNVNDDFIDSFVNVPLGIPNMLMNLLEERDEDIGDKRLITFINHPDWESLDQNERAITYKMLNEGKIDEAHDYHVQYALDFIEKYPQFKPMIKGVEDSKLGFLENIFKL